MTVGLVDHDLGERDSAVSPLREHTIRDTVQVIIERLTSRGHSCTPYDYDLLAWGLTQAYETGELEGEVRAGMRHTVNAQVVELLDRAADCSTPGLIAASGPTQRKDVH